MAKDEAAGEIDRLYQLPLSEFTAARNALAKTAGAGGAAIRALTKPPVPAWAINQVYWRHRDVYDAMIEAANELRSSHKAVLTGKKSDLRTSGKLHEEAVDAALTAALEILSEDGSPATDATKQAIATTLRALPSSDPPGRLTRTLQPGGFEMLAGIPLAGVAPQPRPAPAREPAKPAPRTKASKSEVDPKAVAKAKDALAAATRAVRAAEHTANREQFESARAGRDVEKAERSLAAAREALAAAEESVSEAEREVAAAAKKRDAADRKARAADEAVAKAQSEVEAAQRELDELRE